MKTQRTADDTSDNIRDINVRGTFHPRTGLEGTQGEYRYSSNLSLISAIDGVGDQRHAPATLSPRKRSETHSTGWLGPRALLDGCEESRPHQDSISAPDSPAHSTLFQLIIK